MVVSVASAAVLLSWKKVKALSLVVRLAVAAVLEPAKVVVALLLVTMAALPFVRGDKETEKTIREFLERGDEADPSEMMINLADFGRAVEEFHLDQQIGYQVIDGVAQNARSQPSALGSWMLMSTILVNS